MVAGRRSLVLSKYVPPTEALALVPTLAPQMDEGPGEQGRSLKGAVGAGGRETRGRVQRVQGEAKLARGEGVTVRWFERTVWSCRRADGAGCPVWKTLTLRHLRTYR